MRLESKELHLDVIMLDPNNPRDVINTALNQKELQDKIMSSSEAKDILRSMQQATRWVNRIVVRDINTLSSKEKCEIGLDGDYKFMTVEGNTRVACLKHLEMLGYFDRNERIPVLEAIKEEGESQLEYEIELRVIQGIANVTVVKDWRPIAKAKHLYKQFRDKESLNPGYSMGQIIKTLADGLGMKKSDVRSAVIRYSFYDEISRRSDALDEEQFKFLEAFDVNENTRSIFGMLPQSIDFEWRVFDDNQQTEETSIRNELLNEIPNIVNSARREGLISKEFRNAFRSIINLHEESNIEEIKNEIIEIIDEKLENKTWREAARVISIQKSDEEIEQNSDSTVQTDDNNSGELDEDTTKSILKTYLELGGWKTQIAMGKAHGIDIDSYRGKERWIIEVKGSGSSDAMRVNYFLAILGETLQRMCDPNAKYSIALPSLKQYKNLWEKLPKLAKEKIGITALFVDANGNVEEVS